MSVGGRGGLFRNADFRHLFVAHSVTQVGTQVSWIAIPLVAISYLHASTFEVGVLVALESVAWLLIGLPVGAWCDQLRRRRVLVVTDLVRAGALLTVPAAALVDALTIGHLYAVVLTLGVAVVFSDVSALSYLPNLVGRAHLVEGNGKLEGAKTVANAIGPTLGGSLVQALTAPMALIVDAVSFLWSAGWLSRIRTPDPKPVRAEQRRLRHEVGEGLRFVLRNPVLRAVAGTGAIAVLGFSCLSAVLMLFLVREIGLRPATIGVLYSIGSVAAVLGAMVTTRLARRLGPARSLIGFASVAGLGSVLYPLTARGWALGLFVAAQVLGMAAIVAYNIVQVSYRQTVCPDHLLGRMNATMRFLMWGTNPLGGLLGGLLGTVIGLRPTLWVASAVLVASALPLILSPLGPAALRGDREFAVSEEAVLLGDQADRHQP